MIALFAAMEIEVQACLAGVGSSSQRVIGSHPVIHADGVLICRTGIGRRAKDVAEAVLADARADVVLSVGTAGGLHADAAAGDVVVCGHVHHADARGDMDDAPARSDEHLLRMTRDVAVECGLNVRLGDAVTVDSPAWTCAEKADLHRWKRHDVVEMESYWIGRVANERGIPFLAVRTVSDQADHELVPGEGMSEDGTFDTAAFGRWIRERPELVPLFARQAEANRKAIGALSAIMTVLLPRLIAVFAPTHPA